MFGPRVRGWVPVRVVRGWRVVVGGMWVGGLGGLVVVVVDIFGVSRMGVDGDFYLKVVEGGYFAG